MAMWQSENLSTDYEGRCGNCHSFLGDDEYCRYCGTKKGEGKFEPYENFMSCVYGSPITYFYKCEKCGTEFQSCGMGGGIASFCYKCGNSVTREEKDSFSYGEFSETAAYPKTKGKPGIIYKKQETKKQEKWLFVLLLALGVTLCIELLALMLLIY